MQNRCDWIYNDVDPIEEKKTVNGKVDMLSLHLVDGKYNIICSSQFSSHFVAYNKFTT